MAESGIYNPRQILCVSEPSRFVLSESGETPIKCGSAILVIQVCIKIDGCAAPILQFFSFFILNLLTMHRFFGLWIRWFQWKCYFSNIWLSNAIHKISFITKGFFRTGVHYSEFSSALPRTSSGCEAGAQQLTALRRLEKSGAQTKPIGVRARGRCQK